MVRKNCESCGSPFLQSGIHDIKLADKYCTDCDEIQRFNDGKGLTRSLSQEPEPEVEIEQGQMELGV